MSSAEMVTLKEGIHHESRHLILFHGITLKESFIKIQVIDLEKSYLKRKYSAHTERLINR